MELRFTKEIYVKKKLGFSLPEVLITLGILAILMAVLLPTLKNAKPDENEMLHKKSSFIVNKVLNEIATDEFLYPNNGEYTGLSNTAPVTVNGQIHSGETKFCTLFASRLNLKVGASVNCKADEKTLTSVEGIDWYLPISDFKDVDFASIKVDVNGDKKPNAFGKDQYEYKVRSGDKVPVKAVEMLPPTVGPGARPGMPDAPDVNPGEKSGQKWWEIDCAVNGPGKIYGVGKNKPNGNYKLVAIPNAGYKGSWFTKNVTVKDSNVTDCSVSFEAWSCAIPGACPGNDGGTITPPPVDPDPTPEETYCIEVVMTGDKTQCAYAGAGCTKAPGKHVVTASSNPGYKPSWSLQNPVIVDKNISIPLECNKEDEPEKCYSITTTGDTVNCPVTLPKTTCKADKTKYTDGTYSLMITPKPGYIFEGSPNAANRNVIVAGADPKPFPVTCSVVTSIPLSISFTYGSVIEPYARMWTNMTIEQPGLKPSSVDLILGITKDSKVFNNQYSYPSGTKFTFTNFKSHYIASNMSSVEANQIFNSTNNFGVVYHNNKTYNQSGKVEGVLNAATTLDFFLDTQGAPPSLVKCPGQSYYDRAKLCVAKADATYNVYNPVYESCRPADCNGVNIGPGNWSPDVEHCRKVDYCNGKANYWASYRDACSAMGSGWRLPTMSELQLIWHHYLSVGVYWSSEYEGGASPRIQIDGGDGPGTTMPAMKIDNGPRARCVKTFDPNSDYGPAK